MTALVLSAGNALSWLRDFDRVWLAFIIVSALTAVFDLNQAMAGFEFTLLNLLTIAPFLALAVGLAAYARASRADSLIARVFQGHQSTMIILAALFGTLSPFCSCGVIPLVAGLLRMGVPIAPVMAFWLASPLMDPQIFAITAASLGLEFGVARAISALAIGLTGGFATMLALRAGLFANPLREFATEAPGSGCGTAGNAPIVWRIWQRRENRKLFAGEALTTTLFLGKWLALAFLLESLMLRYVPADQLADLLGGSSPFAIPLAVLIGIPAYMNGFAAVPLINGLMGLGMNAGAALSFMTAGAITCIPASVAVFALVRRAVFAWYVILALGGALSVGYLYAAYRLLG